MLLLAIIIKDLRAYSRNKILRNIQIIYICVLSLMLFLMVVELTAQRRQNFAGFDYGRVIFSTFIVVAFLLLIALSTPISVILNVVEEKKAANLELLLLTPLKHSHILFSKIVVPTFYAIFMLFSSLPLLSLSVYAGGLPLRQTGLCFLIIFVTTLAFNLIGMFYAFASQCEKMSIILSYATVCILTFAPFLGMLSAKVFDFDIQSIPMIIIKVFSPLYAILTVLDVVNEALEISLPSWAVTIILQILISVAIFSVIRKMRLDLNSKGEI